MRNEERITLQETYRRFCASSSIHGTYFWYESKTFFTRCVWHIIVIVGMCLATMFIYQQNLAWKQNPVVTSVKQIPIEEIHFPAITVCPLDHTRYF